MIPVGFVFDGEATEEAWRLERAAVAICAWWWGWGHRRLLRYWAEESPAFCVGHVDGVVAGSGDTVGLRGMDDLVDAPNKVLVTPHPEIGERCRSMIRDVLTPSGWTRCMFENDDRHPYAGGDADLVHRHHNEVRRLEWDQFGRCTMTLHRELAEGVGEPWSANRETRSAPERAGALS